MNENLKGQSAKAASANEKKLIYSENIGLMAFCPTIEKKYTKESELLEDYDKFKVLWKEISAKDFMHNHIYEEVEKGHKILALTQRVEGDLATSQTLKYVKSVEIYY